MSITALCDKEWYTTSRYSQGEYDMGETRNTQQSPAFAITAMVTGIVGLVFASIPVFGLLISTVAVVFGALGVRKTAGKGMAIAGLVTGIIGASIGLIIMLVLIISALSYPYYY